MIICLCHRVSDRDIARETANGCMSFQDLQDELKVGCACGACLESAEEAFFESASACGRCPGHGRCGGATVALS